MWYVFLGLEIILVVLMIMFHVKNRYPQLLVFKTLASLGFVILCVMTVWQKSFNTEFFSWTPNYMALEGRTTWLVVSGLTFGMAGDVILGIKAKSMEERDKLLSTGMLVFGLGHLVFFAALLTHSSFTFFALGIAAGSVPFVFILKEKEQMQMGNLLLPSVLYMFVLSLVAAQAWHGYIIAGDSWFLMMAIGLTLFLLSDVVLSFIYFAYRTGPLMQAINLSLYYAAQIVIATSIVLL